jgi:hypothetical protein
MFEAKFQTFEDRAAGGDAAFPSDETDGSQ